MDIGQFALDQAGLVGEHHGLNPVAQVELGEQDMRDVGLDVFSPSMSSAAISAFERPRATCLQHLELACA